jgi:beta-ketodecanoyl-[acyl-carrier-protein] synthase
VFKEVLPLVSKHISDHLADTGVPAADLTRLWLHQANKTMNDYIGKKVLGRTPEPIEQPKYPARLCQYVFCCINHWILA